MQYVQLTVNARGLDTCVRAAFVHFHRIIREGGPCQKRRPLFVACRLAIEIQMLQSMP